MTEEEMKAQIEKLTASVQKLQDKNEELLTEAKTAKAKARDAEQAKEEAAEEARKKAEEAAAASGDIDALRKQLEAKHAKEIEKLTGERDGFKGQLNKLVIDGGIDAALDAAGMAPGYKRMLRRDFAAEHEIEIRDGQAFVGGDPLSDVVKKWTETDEVSGLKAASQASGSGAPGGGKQSSGSLAEMDGAARLEMLRKNPEQFRRIAGRQQP